MARYSWVLVITELDKSGIQCISSPFVTVIVYHGREDTVVTQEVAGSVVLYHLSLF